MLSTPILGGIRNNGYIPFIHSLRQELRTYIGIVGNHQTA